MKDTTVVAIGAGFILTGVALHLINKKVNTLSDNVSKVLDGIDAVSNNIDISIPETVVNSAAQNAANKAAEGAVTALKNSMAKEIESQVKNAVSEAYKSVEGDVKSKLEEQINLQTIEDIKNKVSGEIVKKIFTTNNFPLRFTSSDSKESIIKTCAENGMSAWEIERILKEIK